MGIPPCCRSARAPSKAITGSCACVVATFRFVISAGTCRMGGVSLLKYHQNLSKMMDLGGQITRNLIQIHGILELVWLILFSQAKVPQQTYSLFFRVFFFFFKGTKSNSTRLQFRCQQSRALASGAINLYHLWWWYKVTTHLPSGEPTFCHGKSPFFMGKSTINGHFPLLNVSSPEGMVMLGVVDSIEFATVYGYGMVWVKF